MAAAVASGAAAMRLDRFLWFVRLAKTRSIAQAVATNGHVRIDGRIVDRAHAPVRVGSVVALPLHGQVRILRVRGLPSRRGPAPEAQACYEELGGETENVSQQPPEY